ncbi:hypothetical protein POSPLADRAFT_1042455 [Postia placenta MAD-698-R-SB12]|uniref:Wax synthase domain-containing protein n=1 Tax=Postia placenta MAD-698-R-SB12 TaxID=670580 RepID=A0A1X6NEY8_9APHY|nr:hypothetical protein POSPLADRAFT_1042455 [Postia placenta MAD-698-R-SB12]OSX67195.1 hypothetical protein POSPLADRAFT_1042455 [Postia placenta MAD-698-R-SB12]
MPRRATLYEELSVGTRLAIRTLIPPPQQREPLRWNNFHRAFVYFIPFLFMAYLVRRAHTYPIRLLLLPTLITSTIYSTYHFRVDDPSCVMLDWLRCMMAYYIISKSLNFGLTPGGRFKIGEKRLLDISETEHQPRGGKQSLLPTWLADALEVTFVVRGFGWDFGKGVHAPPDSRSMERRTFLQATALSFFKNVFITDLSDSLLKLVPGVGSVKGGSIFKPELPTYPRYTLSTTIHIAGGTMVVCGLEACYDLATLIAVGLLGHSPPNWPPLFGGPWRATSLRELWGESWHQLLRHMFLIYGGYPGYWLGGRAGMVFGAFLASGVFHALALNIHDHRVILFFVMQAVGILAEVAWVRVTGRRVGGVVGWLWKSFFVLVLGQMCVDAWAIGGFAGATLVPKRLSIVRQALFPVMRLVFQQPWQ